MEDNPTERSPNPGEPSAGIQRRDSGTSSMDTAVQTDPISPATLKETTDEMLENITHLTDIATTHEATIDMFKTVLCGITAMMTNMEDREGIGRLCGEAMLPWSDLNRVFAQATRSKEENDEMIKILGNLTKRIERQQRSVEAYETIVGGMNNAVGILEQATNRHIQVTGNQNMTSDEAGNSGQIDVEQPQEASRSRPNESTETQDTPETKEQYLAETMNELIHAMIDAQCSSSSEEDEGTSDRSERSMAARARRRNRRKGSKKEPISPPSPKKTRVEVSNLHEKVTVDDLKELFGDIGRLNSVIMVKPGTAYVTYRRDRDATQAVEVYNHRLLDGKPMKCQLFVDNTRPNPYFGYKPRNQDPKLLQGIHEAQQKSRKIVLELREAELCNNNATLESDEVPVNSSSLTETETPQNSSTNWEKRPPCYTLNLEQNSSTDTASSTQAAQRSGDNSANTSVNDMSLEEKKARGYQEAGDETVDPNAQLTNNNAKEAGEEEVGPNAQLDNNNAEANSETRPTNNSLDNLEADLKTVIRVDLLSKPMTATEILRKMTQLETGLSKEELMPLLVDILKKLNPEKRSVDGKVYLSLRTDRCTCP